jgi:hypothetical protein
MHIITPLQPQHGDRNICSQYAHHLLATAEQAGLKRQKWVACVIKARSEAWLGCYVVQRTRCQTVLNSAPPPDVGCLALFVQLVMAALDLIFHASAFLAHQFCVSQQIGRTDVSSVQRVHVVMPQLACYQGCVQT